MTPPKHPTVCNICGGKVSYVSNARVYGSRYGSGWCYLCESCGAYVGTHGPRPREALGILADKRMRRLKMECHELFDRTWDTNAERRERYARLAGNPSRRVPFRVLRRSDVGAGACDTQGGRP